MPVRRGRRHRAEALRAARPARRRVQRLPARHRRGRGLRPARARPVRPVQGPSLQRQQAATRPVRARDRRPLRVAARAPRLPAGPSRRPAVLRRARQRRRRAEGPRRAGGRARARVAQRAANRSGRRGALRGAREGLQRAAAGRAAGTARHLRRPRASRVGGALQGAGRHHAVAAARAVPRRRAGAGRARPRQLLGLQHAGLLLPRPAPRGEAGRSGRRQRRVPRDGGHAARAWPGGGAGRGLQPHARGQRGRPHDQLPRHRQRELVPADARRRGAHGEPHRLRQHGQRRASARDAVRARFASLLGAGDGGRRFQVRSRAGAGAHEPGLPARRTVLHRATPGPDPGAGAPDRGALGCRARRLPGGALPRPLPRMERQVPRHGAPLLAVQRHARGGGARRARAPLHGLQRPVQPRPAHAARVGELHRRA